MRMEDTKVRPKYEAELFEPQSLAARTNCHGTGEVVARATFRRRDADGRDRWHGWLLARGAGWDGRAPRKVANDSGFEDSGLLGLMAR